MLIAWSSQAVMFIIVFAWSLCMDGDELHPVYWLFRFLFLNFIYFIFVHPVFLRRTPTRIIRKIRVWPEDEKERTVEINEKGLEFEDGAGHVHFPLSYIHDVKKNDAYLLVSAFSSFSIIMPTRAFPSKDQIDLAFELLRSKIEKPPIIDIPRK